MTQAHVKAACVYFPLCAAMGCCRLRKNVNVLLGPNAGFVPTVNCRTARIARRTPLLLVATTKGSFSLRPTPAQRMGETRDTAKQASALPSAMTAKGLYLSATIRCPWNSFAAPRKRILARRNVGRRHLSVSATTRARSGRAVSTSRTVLCARHKAREVTANRGPAKLMQSAAMA